MSEPKEETPRRVDAFLAAIAECPHIGRAAKAAKLSRSAHYKRYERDPKYAAAFDTAWRHGVGRLRDCAIERVLFGIEEPVIYQGEYQFQELIHPSGKIEKRMVTVRKYPERLHMKVLGAELPDVYATRIQHQHSGQVEVLVQRLQAARKRAAGQAPPQS